MMKYIMCLPHLGKQFENQTSFKAGVIGPQWWGPEPAKGRTARLRVRLACDRALQCVGVWQLA